MKKRFLASLLALFILTFSPEVKAQCSVCSRNTEQLGEKPARGLNSGIIYLMVAPLAIIGLIGYRWWRRNGDDI